MTITEHTAKSARHTTFYLADGPEDGPLVIFVHGWPELSVSWRHQMPCLAALGFRAIAPDMRGYGRSSVYSRHEDYALEQVVQDLVELLASLGRDKAIWVGHDWGSPAVWSFASHHPGKCLGVVNLCVPHIPNGFAPANLIPLVDRALYPESEFPAGQWEYMLAYEENFAAVQARFEADIKATTRALFRAGDPNGGKAPAMTAYARKMPATPSAPLPALPLDTTVVSEEDYHKYAASLQRNGFFGPDSWYMNGARNIDFAKRWPTKGKLEMPVLFLHAEYDYVCMTVGTRLADPMRQSCSDLTEVTVKSGHWMAQEKPVEVNAAIVRWLARQFPQLWPQ